MNKKARNSDQEVCEVCHGSSVVRTGNEEEGWFSADCDFCHGTGMTVRRTEHNILMDRAALLMDRAALDARVCA